MRVLSRSLAALVAVALAAGPARADRDPCAAGAIHRGAAIDLNVRGADLQDVLAWIADAGRVNVVIAEDVRGPVRLRLRRVAWDLALCTIVRVHHLAVTVDGNVFLVRRAIP